jgi:hypothetical protein
MARHALIILALLCAPVFAADVPVAQLVDKLDDDSPEVRQQAMSDLMLREDLTDKQLGEALRAATGPEQRHRLTLVAMHRFFSRMNPTGAAVDEGTGSIGIDIDVRNIVRPDQHPAIQRPAMLISRTRPGFPGFAILRPGDLVVGVNGESFADDLDQTDFINAIQKYQVGETMRLDVLRDGQRLEVPIKLDSLRRLQEVHARLADVPDPTMYAPWRIHLANLLDSDEPDPVVKLVDPAPEKRRETDGVEFMPDPAHGMDVRVLPGGKIQIRGQVQGQLQIRNGQVIVIPPGGQPRIIHPQPVE